MKEIQPSIMSEQGLTGYRAGLSKLEALMQDYELTIADQATDPDWREYTRTKLRRLYNIRQGFLDAIQAYLEQSCQSV